MFSAADWPGERRAVVRADGTEGDDRWFVVTRGVSMNYWPKFSALVVEASLPKLLRGENWETIGQADEVFALGAVDALVHDTLRPTRSRLGPFADWAPNRLDAVRQLRTGDRAGLVRFLKRARDLEVPRWGRPVVGQALSLTWGKRTGQRARAYDKWREVNDAGQALARQGGAAAEDARSAPEPRPLCPVDLLRVEGVLRRPKVIRRLMGDGSATLVQALRSGVAEAPLLRVWPLIERVMEDDVKEDEAFRRLVKTHGWRRMFRLMGFARVVAEMGVEELGEHMDRTTIWRDMRDLRAAGVDPSAVEWEGALDAALARGTARTSRWVTSEKKRRAADEARRRASA